MGGGFVRMVRNSPFGYGRFMMPTRSALSLLIVGMLVCMMANDVLAAGYLRRTRL